MGCLDRSFEWLFGGDDFFPFGSFFRRFFE